MNIRKIFCTLAVLLLLLSNVSESVSAEARNIYVGDTVTLKIESTKLSAEELTHKFQDPEQGFEIIDIKNEPDGYLISVRTFNVGEHAILLGDKEVVINVSSTLNDLERDDIFEGEMGILESGFLFHWRIIFYVTAGAFALITGFVSIKAISRRRTKPDSFYKLFMKRASSLSLDDENYFVYLTLYLKEYLEGMCHCRIIGKTSEEIVRELKALALQRLDSILPEIQEWLTECDRLKFTGVEASNDEKSRHYTKLIDLTGKIDSNLLM